MARRGPKQAANQARTEQERARRYQARVQWNADQKRRRVRDNIIAGIAGGILVIGAFASQAVHANVTQPAPEPTVTSSPTPTVSEPAVDETDEPGTDETPVDEAPAEEEPAGDEPVGEETPGG